MDITELLDRARDTIGVGRVFGEPIELDGMLAVPAAIIGGGGGGGSGTDDDGSGGQGGGFGVGGRPAGMYVVRDGDVTWRPAVDVNRLLTTVAVVAVVFMVTRTIRARIRARADARSSAD